MDAPLEVLAEVTGRLEATGIAYMLSGAMALSFYAHPRMTRKSPGERVHMAASMFASAREVVLSSIRQQHPGISPTEERVQLFRRFYEADLTPAQVERYVALIRASGGSALTSGDGPSGSAKSALREEADDDGPRRPTRAQNPS